MDSIKQLQSVAAPGTIITSMSLTPPEGYLRLEGQRLKQSDYPDLYNAIAVSNGNIVKTVVLGVTYFYLPNFSGVFLRQVGGYSAGLGVIQADAIINITGRAGIQDDQTIASAPNGAFYNAGGYGYDSSSGMSGGGWVLAFDSSLVVPTADENRPVNVSVNYFIKY